MVSENNSVGEFLPYFHDARCLEVIWDCTDSNLRAVRLKIIVDPEAGSPSWDGKTLLILFTDGIAARLTGWGFTIGNERIDDCRQGISDILEHECNRLLSAGINIPPLKLTFSFHSGSELELVCASVAVTVCD
jgi:hypothetical protein